MDTIQPKIHALGGKWQRFVILRLSPEPPHQREYWDGGKWVAELRAALLYAHLTLVRGDLKKLQPQD